MRLWRKSLPLVRCCVNFERGGISGEGGEHRHKNKNHAEREIRAERIFAERRRVARRNGIKV